MLRVMLLSILLVLIVNPALAQNLVTFEYSGPDFTNVVSGARFTTSDSISGAFTIDCDAIPATVDCLSLPLANYTAAVTSFSFTASGSPNLTITSANANLGIFFSFQTSEVGEIHDSYSIGFETSSEGGAGARIDLAETFSSVNARAGSSGGEGVASSPAGTWTGHYLETYAYTGANFSVVSGTRFSASDSVTATLTIDCGLIPGTFKCRSLPFADYTAAVRHSSFTASGAPDLTITSDDALPVPFYRFETDANGEISGAYNMALESSLEGGGGARITTSNTGGFTVARAGAAGGEGRVDYAPGVWQGPTGIKTYEFTGEFLFADFGTRFGPPDPVSGTFTIDCNLIPGTADCRSLPMGDYTAFVTSFSFTATGSPDLTITSADSAPTMGFVFSTDGNCDISGAAMFLSSSLPGAGGLMNIFLTGGFVVDGSTDATFDGVWATIPTPVPPKPVPVLSAWGTLLTISLLVALGARVPSRRRAAGVG